MSCFQGKDAKLDRVFAKNEHIKGHFCILVKDILNVELDIISENKMNQKILRQKIFSKEKKGSHEDQMILDIEN